MGNTQESTSFMTIRYLYEEHTVDGTFVIYELKGDYKRVVVTGELNALRTLLPDLVAHFELEEVAIE